MLSNISGVALVALTFSAQVYAHAIISPALGVDGAPRRADVERPSTARPCGGTNIAANIDSTTPIIAEADGTFVATVTNFNGGRDGSRQVTLTVDATGTGKKFVAGKVTKNGTLAPKATGSEKVTASLPAGTKCTGGTSGNLCLASFKTAGGFGNCVVVKQTATGHATSSSVDGAATATTSPTAAQTSSTSANNVNTNNFAVAAEAPPRKNKARRAVAGTRAARALRVGLVPAQKREDDESSWIWA